MRRGRGRHLVALHMRECHAAALEHVPLFEDATDAAARADTCTTWFAFPLVADEFLAVHLFQALNDQFLQFEQVFFNGCAV